MLVRTITAFTIAYSVTPALATLGYANLPAPPLEAAIALSILFLGCESCGAGSVTPSLTTRHPCWTAFTFGLLHGFGFASGLSQIGLPRNEISLALVSFNLGVELGQLGFVSVLLLFERWFRPCSFVGPARSPCFLPMLLGLWRFLDPRTRRGDAGRHLVMLCQPTEIMTHEPSCESDGLDRPRLCREGVPGEAAVIDDVGVGLESAVGEPVLPDELPDVLGGIEVRRAGRDRQQGDVRPEPPACRSCASRPDRAGRWCGMPGPRPGAISARCS